MAHFAHSTPETDASVTKTASDAAAIQAGALGKMQADSTVGKDGTAAISKNPNAEPPHITFKSPYEGLSQGGVSGSGKDTTGELSKQKMPPDGDHSIAANPKSLTAVPTGHGEMPTMSPLPGSDRAAPAVEGNQGGMAKAPTPGGDGGFAGPMQPGTGGAQGGYGGGSRGGAGADGAFASPPAASEQAPKSNGNNQ
jgi:hypothetical protein